MGRPGQPTLLGFISSISRCPRELSCLRAPTGCLQPQQHCICTCSLPHTSRACFYWGFSGFLRANTEHCHSGAADAAKAPRRWQHRQNGCSDGIRTAYPWPHSPQPQAQPRPCPDTLPGTLELLPDTQNTPHTVSLSNTDFIKTKYVYWDTYTIARGKYVLILIQMCHGHVLPQPGLGWKKTCIFNIQ